MAGRSMTIILSAKVGGGGMFIATKHQEQIDVPPFLIHGISRSLCPGDIASILTPCQ